MLSIEHILARSISYDEWLELDAATPAQLCVTAAGLEYYFIGPDGVEAGPLLPTMIELGETYPAFPAVADTPYSVDKPYIFTLNESYEVTYQAW